MKKIGDLLVVILLLVAGVSISLFYRVEPLVGSVFFLLVPSCYLLLRSPRQLRKVLWSILLIGGLFGFTFDFIETFNGAWFVERLVFPLRIFGVVPLDDVFGFLFMTLFIVVFYRYFLGGESTGKVSKNFLWGVVPAVLVLVGSVALFFVVEPEMLRIPYAYLVGGTLAVVFPIIILAQNPRMILKLLPLWAFFFFVWLASEIVALKTGGWSFPGEYLGMVSLLGVSFPFEELVFWMVLYAPAVAVYHEFFIEDLS